MKKAASGIALTPLLVGVLALCMHPCIDGVKSLVRVGGV